MARLRTNPSRRPLGALLINPRRPKRARRALRSRRGILGRFKLRNPKQSVSGYTRERPWTTYKKSAAWRQKAKLAAAKRRRPRSRKGRKTRRNPLVTVARSNPRRRKARRNGYRAHASYKPGTRRKSSRVRHASLGRRRNPLFVTRSNPLFTVAKRNPSRRRKSRKSKGFGALFVRNPAGGVLGKIPVIGPVLASMMGYVPHAAFGAVSVEPVMFTAQMAAPYLPVAMPFSLTIGLGGLLVGALVKRFAPFSAATNEKLATACVAGAGAIAYWEWRNGNDAPVAEKMGALISTGYGSPLAGAIMGDASLGYLQHAGSLADYGPMAVTPFNAAPVGGYVSM